jgi:DNA-binding SARP family transcriptional activator
MVHAPIFKSRANVLLCAVGSGGLIVNIIYTFSVQQRIAVMKNSAGQPEISDDIKPFRLILLSPRSYHPTLGLQLLSDACPATYFVSLQGEVSSLEQLLEQTVEALREQLPNLDSRLGKALRSGKAQPEALAEALLADLEGKGRLVLDCFDRARLDNRFAQFFHRLAAAEPEYVQVIINSRILDREFWGPFVADETAHVLGEDLALSGGILTPERSRVPQLEVYAFRNGAVYVDGKPITEWEGPLVKGLFFYLIDHPMLTRQEIFDTFWPSLSRKEATNVFHVTKRKLEQCLGLELTDYKAGFYRPSSKLHLHYDVAAFEALNPQTEAEYKEVIRLHRNPFLYKLDASWIRERRRELKSRYVDALVGLARLYRSSGQQDLAILYYSRAQQQVPEREDVARALMELCAADGHMGRVTQVFEQLTQALRGQLNIQPSAQTRKVYETIIKQHR